MTNGTGEHDLRREDRRTDLVSLFWLGGFLTLGQIVGVWSYATELARAGGGTPTAKVALYEFSSLAVIFALFPLVATLVSRAMPLTHGWRRIIAVHAGGLALFSLLHTAGFVLLRKLFQPLLFGGETYVFTDNLLRDGLYEFRKDIVLYAAIAAVLIFGRQLAQARRELAAAKADARQSRQIAIRSNGRIIYLPADAILWARAAGNYVEICAAGQIQTVRSTLGALIEQVGEATSDFARAHRSWAIGTRHLRELRATGTGDAVAVMSNGDEVPVSRRYRDSLTEKVSP